MRGGNWLHCPLDPANEFVRLEGLVQAPDGIRLPTLITGKQALGGGGDLAPIAGLASLGIDAQGNIYIADAAANRVIRIDGCSGQRCALPCLRGPGSGPGELREPGGLAVDPIRNRLYISDTGNHRIQVLDLATEQVIAIWSAGEVWGRGEASTLPGAFTAPGDLAVDD
ncbi:MAG: hypothetical protein GY946_21410, partial [bacterium]|nr:hypothetical protein [bacterium]